MVGTQTNTLPPGWKLTHSGKRSRYYENDSAGVYVTVEPVFRAKRASVTITEAPIYYKVNIKQDWFSEGLVGDQSRADRVETMSTAVELAQIFMKTYNRNRNRYNKSREEILCADGGDEDPEEVTTEVATETAMDLVGYDDRSLIKSAKQTVGEALRTVHHRDNDSLEMVYARDDTRPDLLLTILGFLCVDKPAFDRTIPLGNLHTTSHQIGSVRVIRFLKSADRETVVTADAEDPLDISTVERTVRHVVNQKW